ncbi:hypothetical protein FQN57_002434 [Myotisia sp. PD_48]|nr:hypothetical protein FQN57_002434 [Myotisia sp. PD_48]
MRMGPLAGSSQQESGSYLEINSAPPDESGVGPITVGIENQDEEVIEGPGLVDTLNNPMLTLAGTLQVARDGHAKVEEDVGDNAFSDFCLLNKHLKTSGAESPSFEDACLILGMDTKALKCERTELQPWQVTGVAWMLCHEIKEIHGGILADELGLAQYPRQKARHNMLVMIDVILGTLTIGPWAFLILYDILLYIWRATTYEIPIIGGRARGRRRPIAPSLTERSNGRRRAFSMTGTEYDGSGGTANPDKPEDENLSSLHYDYSVGTQRLRRSVTLPSASPTSPL